MLHSDVDFVASGCVAVGFVFVLVLALAALAGIRIRLYSTSVFVLHRDYTGYCHWLDVDLRSRRYWAALASATDGDSVPRPHRRRLAPPYSSSSRIQLRSISCLAVRLRLCERRGAVAEMR